LRYVSQAYQTTDFHDLTYFLESILVVSLNDYVGCTTNGFPLAAESHLQYLNGVIKGTVIDEKDDHHDDDDVDNIVDDDQKVEGIISNWKTWAQTLYTAPSVESKTTEGSVINACFNSDFADQFVKQLLPYLPLWSGIM
jgi:hypothetical protein